MERLPLVVLEQGVCVRRRLVTQDLRGPGYCLRGARLRGHHLSHHFGHPQAVAHYLMTEWLAEDIRRLTVSELSATLRRPPTPPTNS